MLEIHYLFLLCLACSKSVDVFFTGDLKWTCNQDYSSLPRKKMSSLKVLLTDNFE